MKRGNLLVVSAPSGAGKTTILTRILDSVPRVAFSVSHTTRPPRPGERDGVDYHFVDRDSFIALRDRGGFLEWAEVHGNLYGTSRQAVEVELAQGLDVLLDIDVQGANQLRERSDLEAAFVFIAPPSLAELEARLTGRSTDSPETIRLRLANARRELAEADRYDYLVVNDLLERAVDMLRAIILAERSRSRRDAEGLPLRLPVPGSS